MLNKTIVGAVLFLIFYVTGCGEEASSSLYFEWFLYNKNDSTSVSTAADVEFSVKSNVNSLVNNADIIPTGIIRACIVFSASFNDVKKDNPEFTVIVYNISNTIIWDTIITYQEADFSNKPIPGENYSNLLSELEFYID